MPEIIIITGPCGVGKSTLAKAWAIKKQGAIIDSGLLQNGFSIKSLGDLIKKKHSLLRLH